MAARDDDENTTQVGEQQGMQTPTNAQGRKSVVQERIEYFENVGEAESQTEPGDQETTKATAKEVATETGEGEAGEEQAGAEYDEIRTTNLVVIGSIGDGKSTLIKTLLDPVLHEKMGGKEIECKMAGAGVTKDCRAYPMINTDGHVQLIDTPGVGDHDAKLSSVVPKIEQYFQNKAIGVDGVILCCSVGQGRVTLGIQIASAILKMAVFDHNPEARKHLIVVGTKADRLDEEDLEEWMEQVGPIFETKVGGPPGYIVLTKCKKTAKGRGKNDVESLLNAIKEIREQSFKMEYTEVDAEKMMNIVAESTGLDATSGEMAAMIEELKENRKLMQENNKKMMQQYEEMKAQQQKYEEEKKEAEKEKKEAAAEMRKLQENLVHMQQEQLEIQRENERKREEAHRQQRKLQEEYQRKMEEHARREEKRQAEAQKNENRRRQNEKEEREQRQREEKQRQEELQRLFNQMAEQQRVAEELRKADEEKQRKIAEAEAELQQAKKRKKEADAKAAAAEASKPSTIMNIVDAIPIIGTLAAIRKLW